MSTLYFEPSRGRGVTLFGDGLPAPSPADPRTPQALAVAAGAQPVRPLAAFAMHQRRKVTGRLGEPHDAEQWLVVHHLTTPTARRCVTCKHRAVAPCQGCTDHRSWTPHPCQS